eukprot:2123670-Rhodomonas_salina.2
MLGSSAPEPVLSGLGLGVRWGCRVLRSPGWPCPGALAIRRPALGLQPRITRGQFPCQTRSVPVSNQVSPPVSHQVDPGSHQVSISITVSHNHFTSQSP